MSVWEENANIVREVGTGTTWICLVILIVVMQFKQDKNFVMTEMIVPLIDVSSVNTIVSLIVRSVI